MVWTERNPNGSRVAGKAEIGARWGQSGRSLVEARVRTALEQRLAPGKSSRARPEWSRGRQGASGSPKTDRRHRGGDFEELSPGAAHDQGYIRSGTSGAGPMPSREIPPSGAPRQRDPARPPVPLCLLHVARRTHGASQHADRGALTSARVDRAVLASARTRPRYCCFSRQGSS